MSAKVDREVLAVGRDGSADTVPDSTECQSANENLAQKPRPLTTTALIVPAVTQAVEKGSLTPSSLEAPKVTLDPQTSALLPPVGGACNIVHVLEWKEGVALLPGSNLKFRMRDCGTLEVVSDDKVACVGATPESVAGKQELDPRQSQKSEGGAADPVWGVVDDGKREDSLVHCGVLEPSAPRAYPQEVHTPPGNERSEGGEKGHEIQPSAVNPDLLKPVKKRKRKDYLCPSEEESDAEGGEEKSEGVKTESLADETEQIRPESLHQPGVTEIKSEIRTTWTQYLEDQRAVAAPPELFQESQRAPHYKNGFRQWMKLEGIDPQHPSMYSVLTVAEVCGYRIRLHFDGYSDCHDFWVNANCPEIHPAGWCERTAHKLYTPKGCKEEEFSWSNYLRVAKAQVAPKELFVSSGTVEVPCSFEVGMKLEAVDRMNPSLICVATVTDAVDGRFLVHFDNWDDTYDYWCDASSPYIHPIGWCQERGLPLTPPQDYPDPDRFSWEKYLEETGSTAVAPEAFKVRPPHGFKVQMKLEAVDRRSPALVRVATVEEVDSHRIKIHFDGWSHVYDEWVDSDHPDIHPAGWCQQTGHPLKWPPCDTATQQPSPREPPPSGQTSLSSLPCKAITHPRTNKYSFHHRIGRPPKYRKGQQRAYQSLSAEAVYPSLFMSALSAHPDRSLSLCWEQHCKLLPGVAGIHASKVAGWTVDEVFGFVHNLTGCEEQARLFRDEMIDGEAFLLLNQTDIVKIMSIKLGPALKIYNAILMFKSTDEGLK